MFCFGSPITRREKPMEDKVRFPIQINLLILDDFQKILLLKDMLNGEYVLPCEYQIKKENPHEAVHRIMKEATGTQVKRKELAQRPH